ncbi:class B sortase [Clostridium porci]|uniref:Class B sortase n=1 Tax=Clostridium porci TaxID=2605778 RepID=A0A7X2NNX2_9CLOT|nr:class B sortase [Clostridium porci]MSS38195.1 class B sortase [Clostridium porci]
MERLPEHRGEAYRPRHMKPRKKRKWYISLGILSSFTLLLLSLFMLGSSILGLAKSQAAFETLAARVETEKNRPETANESAPTMEGATAPSPYAELKEENEDLFGWVTIAGTKVDYPVMYTPQEPEYYLRRAFDKSHSVSGVPFLDGNFIEGGNHYLVYGHNMKNGTMFHALLDYGKPEFWKEHPSITFDTLQESGTYAVIGAFYSRVYYQDETDVFRFYAYPDLSDPALFAEYVDNVEAASLYDTGETAEYGDVLLTLVTCSYHTENGRFVVVARKE